MELKEVTLDVVLKYLCKVPPKKSSTPEGIPAIFYKRSALGLAEPLTMIYNRSLREAKVPSLYRTAIIAPVHKTGDKADPANKRPVSLTAVLSKVLESIIADVIYNNANGQGLISDCQFAYRPGRSATQCVLEFLSDAAICLMMATRWMLSSLT